MPAGVLRDLFFVTDHLGNVRSVVDVSPDLTDPVILEQDDYLPFGTKVQNPSFAGVEDNRYHYANKEEQRNGGTDLSLPDFGARYYDPYLARWTSVDPMASSFSGVSPFDYCGSNPILNLDKDGRIWDTAWDIANVVMDVQSLVSNIKNGNIKDAVIDGVGLAGDLAAAALPFIPGGAGAGIKAARTGEAVLDIFRLSDNVHDSKRAITISKNASAGKEFEEKFAKILTGDYSSQLSIEAIDGTRVKMDFVQKKGDVIELFETKSSNTAPLTKNQHKAFPQIEETGGVVKGQKGESIGLPAGTIIPPTKVKIIRP